MSVSSFHGARIATVTPSAAAIGALLTVAGTPRLGPQPNSLDNAVSGATHWVRLADGRRSDAMWLEAGALMQKRVPRGEWQRYLRRIRIDRGPLQSREWFEVTRVRDPVGLPEGLPQRDLHRALRPCDAVRDRVVGTWGAGLVTGRVRRAPGAAGSLRMQGSQARSYKSGEGAMTAY